MYKIVNGVRVELTQAEIAKYNNRQARAEIEKALYEKEQKYKDQRKAEFPKTEELVLALWEAVVEGDSTLADQLQNKRIKIKDKYPKPNLKKIKEKVKENV